MVHPYDERNMFSKLVTIPFKNEEVVVNYYTNPELLPTIFTNWNSSIVIWL